MDVNPYEAPSAPITLPQGAYQKPTMKELLFSFQGRIPRRVYWAVTLGMIVVALICGGIFALSETLGAIVLVALLIPFFWISLAVGIKRWHDRNKSGWWVLIGLVPYIGGIWQFVECGCLRGSEGDNNYGPDPT